MHQLLAELRPFENFRKLFAACCLDIIVCKFYFIIGIFFANKIKVMAIWAIYYYYFYLHLLDMHGKVAIIKSL